MNIKYCFYALGLCLFIFAACDSKSVTQEDPLLVQLKKQKSSIDSQLKASSMMVLVKVKGQSELIRITDRGYPKNIEKTYNLFKDDKGRTLFINEMPYSETSDWFIAYKSYFDTTGVLFAFQRLNNFMNSKCAPGAAVENDLKFYNDKRQIIDSVYTLMDTYHKPLAKDSCLFPYNFPYQVIHNLADYKRASGLVN